ncbi:ABC transporter permease subunit [Corticibacter populi]|uniref:ABC transporter permease subunit n=1 Tax=Corticibacter populi TaxID=1550736 RepID=A0A3M6QXH7_9BURK|nr:ABC transporter permease subunit [Corticibacter populi]RMX07735.1 ABC transporter permease subunit [Corticibacter populi]RZS34953.1 NitT/TauT family transport system permease protein [Corticibacter populi]
MTQTALSHTPESVGITTASANHVAAPVRQLLRLGVAGLAWLLAGLVTYAWPDLPGQPGSSLTADLAAVQVLIGALLLAAIPLRGRLGAAGRWFERNGPRLAGLAVLLTIWQVASSKTGYWKQPYVPGPQAIVEVYFKEYARLLDGIRSSLILLATGVGLGAAAGFLTGLATGWSRKVGYWTRPVLRYIGPVPATALIPVALFAFPSSFTAGVFLVALATWFSVAVLTWSGVESVPSEYYDVARTQGSSQWFLLLRVAVPAALPHVFVGLFMGLGSALSVLVVAEMVGVKSGLGYFLDWSQSWGAYGHLIAGLFLMALLFSLLTTALFKLRNKLVVGRKGDIQW